MSDTSQKEDPVKSINSRKSPETVRTRTEHKNALFGLTDGGARCGVIPDARMPTFTSLIGSEIGLAENAGL